MKIAIIGNCQVQSLTVSAKMMLDGVEVESFDYSEQYSRLEENRKRFAAGLKNFDHVFAQPALLSFTSERELRPMLGDKLTTIANFYFRGLFPDSCYVGDFESRLENPSSVNSVIVLDAFRRGLSEEEAVRAFNIETLARLGLLDAWSSSMTEMRKREANGVVDVPAADFMDDACRRYHAFLTMNHPSARFITDYFSKVLDHVGMKHKVPPPDTYRDALADHDVTPIYDFVADHYGLEYRTPQTWRLNSLGRGYTSRADFIAAFYGSYSQAEPATLVVHSPTDMVASFLDSPHQYLVDAAVPPPQVPRCGNDAAGISRATGISHRQLALALRPLKERIDETATFIHKVHSFTEIIDPKVERLAQDLPVQAQRQAELLAAVQVLARRVTILGGLVVALVFIVFISLILRM